MSFFAHVGQQKLVIDPTAVLAMVGIQPSGRFTVDSVGPLWVLQPAHSTKKLILFSFD